MLCRGSDTIDGDDNSVVGDAVEIVLQDFSSATHDDLPSDADNAVSSDDDDARMVLLSELLRSSRLKERKLTPLSGSRHQPWGSVSRSRRQHGPHQCSLSLLSAAG